MDLKNIKISTQLRVGLFIIMLFVFILSLVSYQQHRVLSDKMSTLYEHPFQVKEAIATLKIQIGNMRLSNRDLIESNTQKEKTDALLLINLNADIALDQINIIKSLYLGDPQDIEAVHQAFMKWHTAQSEDIRLAMTGDTQSIKESIRSTGPTGLLREDTLAKIQKIDDFAKNKAQMLYVSLLNLDTVMNLQLLYILLLILLLTWLIVSILLNSLLKPIKTLTLSASKFAQGDMSARSTFISRNELGVLSESFNQLAQNIQERVTLQEKVVHLSRAMMEKYEAKSFFRDMLSSLTAYTGSQLGAVYLLSEDKQYFNFFESIGLDQNVRKSFSVENLEGEFGAVLSSRKMTLITDIPEDSRFVFPTVGGTLVPREILSIPILQEKEVVAIISLASVRPFSNESLQMIEAVMMTLNARVEGVLAYDKMKDVLKKVDLQNHELEVQKEELMSQSTELVQQNRELDQQKQALTESNRLKTNFLSNMSHELRTPLNSVIALSVVLNRRLAKKIPDEELSYLTIIERNGKHLLELINDILDISRIEAGREEVEITTFDLVGQISDLVGLLLVQAKEKNIDLVYEKPDTEVTIATDATKLRHILQNLLSNAIKFTEKGKVAVRSYRVDQQVKVEISDTGIGIAKNQLDYIFDEFRQADGSTSRKFGGTGLGLAIAKKYAHLLEGSISVESTIGKGSTFILSLPLDFQWELGRIAKKNHINDDFHKKPPTPLPNQGLDGKTILLVEDSEPQIIQLRDILEELGYQLRIARDGLEALEMISKEIPDAILLDLMMPTVDGFEVLETLRNEELTASVPVMILTAKHITKEELTFLKRNNVHQLIQKGDINRAELLAMIHQMFYPQPTEISHQEISMRPVIQGKPLVLVVEDNPDNMVTVKALLAEDCEIIEAANGLEAIEKAKKHHPNLVLMDIALPGIDGIQAFKEIRKDPTLQHCSVIALTASAMMEDREAILAHGFNAYIPKPIEENLFTLTIREVLYGK